MRNYRLAPLILAALIAAISVARADQPAELPPLPKGKQAAGTISIGGKTFKLEHVVAYTSKVFDEDMTNLMFSDKPIDVKKLQAALQKGDGKDDSFVTFQTQVKVTFDKEGKPAFCNAYGENNSVSVSGPRLVGDLKIENGQATGNVTLTVDKESDRPSGFAVQFNTPMLKAAVAQRKPEPTPGKTAKAPTEKEKPAAPALKPINVFQLPMPSDAANIERKELVEHIHYSSASSVKAVVGLLQKKLAEQGWKTDGTDFNAPASSILRRKRGEATLTIFVKPATKGCTVQIMADGLNWDEPE